MKCFFLALGFSMVTAFFRSENQNEIPYYEIFHLPHFSPSKKAEFPLDLIIFGKTVKLKLRSNENLISPNFKAYIRDEVFGDQELNFTQSNCHYLHQGENMMAAISLCQEKQAQGILFMPNDTYEIYPLFQSKTERAGVPHMVKKIPFSPHNLGDDISKIILPFQTGQKVKRDQNSKKKKLTIEAALFFDEAGYKIFSPFFKYNDNDMIDMLLAYMNAIQALYHHPSLKQSIDIVLIKLEILKRQPSDLPHFNGERSQLLDSFCVYNQKHNPPGDDNPNHWDMGLYVSGLDFFAYENGKKSGVTMGLAAVGGVCMEKYNCVIAELGTTNIFGKPYPSAGFTSVYVLAHEMGHNIGMHHDSTNNNCPKEGYIMSPSRGTVGETLWSPCSADVVKSMEWAKCLEDAPPKPSKELDHTKYENQPGTVWGAKRQCEILLIDRDAEVHNSANLENICQNLHCKTPHRSGFYFAGPALEGTTCGKNKWCQGGSCVKQLKRPSQTIVKGGWSDWVTEKECSSECIENSKGHESRRRTCTNPKPINTEEGCEGPGYEVMLCKDDKLCKDKRQTVIDYAGKRCKEFSQLIPELDGTAPGLQATYESGRLWMSCAIFCKRNKSNSYYTPRMELNDLNVNPYFPDGTWCHNDGTINYYCVQHHCLPENFKFTKGIFSSDDVLIPQNAPAKIFPTPEEILKYFSIDFNKKPLLTTLKPDVEKPNNEEDWFDKDYIEIPNFPF